MPTALLALVSILVAPAASVACMARCDAAAPTHESAICHNEAHAQAHHANHGGHTHPMAMTSQDSEAAVAGKQPGQHQDISPLACHNAVCSSAIPARPARAVLPMQWVTQPLLDSPAYTSPTIDSRRNSHHFFSQVMNLSCSACPPLRI